MNPALTLAHSNVEMPRSRALRAYAVEAKYESLRMLRMPGFAGPFLLLPVALYLLFAVLLYGAEIAKDPKTGIFMFLGFATFGVMGPGIFGFGITVAMEREQGLLRLKRAVPAPLAAGLVAKMLMSVLFVAIIMLSMIAAAPLGHLRLSGWQLAGLAVVNIAGALPFCAIGFFVGSRASAKAAPAIVNVFYLPMIYLSAILIPLPKSMHWIALMSPAYHLEQAGIWFMGLPAEGSPAVHLAVLAGVTVVFTAIAIRRLRRAG